MVIKMRVLLILATIYKVCYCLMTPLSYLSLPNHYPKETDTINQIHHHNQYLLSPSSALGGRQEWSTTLPMSRVSYSSNRPNKGSNSNNNPLKKFLIPSATNFILISNIIIYITAQVFPSLTNFLMKNDRLISRGQTYRLLSSCFAHGSLYHIGMNLYSLNSLGPQAERLFGTPRFLSIYLMSGVLANMATFLAHSSPYSLGASGCVFGIIGAFGIFYYRNKSILGPSSEVALQSIIRTVGINLFYGASMRGIDSGGHMGGLVAGGLLSYLFGPRLFYKKTENTNNWRTGSTYQSKLIDKPLINYIPYWKKFNRLITSSSDSNYDDSNSQ